VTKQHLLYFNIYFLEINRKNGRMRLFLTSSMDKVGPESELLAEAISSEFTSYDTNTTRLEQSSGQSMISDAC